MPTFGLYIEESKEVIEFVIETNKRLKEDNLATNPFNGLIKNYGSFLAIKIDPIYLNFPFYMTISMCIIGYIFSIGNIAFWIATSIFLCMNVFWTGYFYYIMFVLGLKKKGYKGSFNYIRPSKLAEELLEWDKEKY